MDNTREPGFYWVIATDLKWDQDPHVAEWISRGRWFVCGSECEEPDEAFRAISERLTPPVITKTDTSAPGHNQNR